MKKPDRASMPGALSMAHTLKLPQQEEEDLGRITSLSSHHFGSAVGRLGMTPDQMTAQMGPGQAQFIPTEKQQEIQRAQMTGIPNEGGVVLKVQIGPDGVTILPSEAYRIPRKPPDPYHNECSVCGRLFINNISCPRCGWRLRK